MKVELYELLARQAMNRRSLLKGAASLGAMGLQARRCPASPARRWAGQSAR